MKKHSWLNPDPHPAIKHLDIFSIVPPKYNFPRLEAEFANIHTAYNTAEN